MKILRRVAIALAVASWSCLGTPARAQWMFPAGGYGDFGWGGWGATTPQGDIARGMGVFAAGAGVYNQKTAVAEAINAETVMRWNEYVFQSQQARNRRFRERQARNLDSNIRAQEEIQRRLRDNPSRQDLFRGSALNVALDEINNPRVYAGALKGMNDKIGGDQVRSIPFQYSAAGITMGFHQLATGELPSVLRTDDFRAERESLRALDAQLLQQVEDDKEPDPETVKKVLATIYAAEEKAAKLPKGLEATQATRYLKALHGLVVMLKAPPLDPYLAGVEKRPEVTIGQLLGFMRAFNLRFGPATTPQQREAYSLLYPKLVALRDQASPRRGAVAEAEAEPNVAAVQEFFSAIGLDDLSKAAPKPGS